MTQLFSKYQPPIPAPAVPQPPPPTLSPTGSKPQKATQVPSLLGLAGAGQSESQSKSGGKSLLGQ